MKILLVGDVNSIFLQEYANYLKKYMDIEIHVYSLSEKSEDVDYSNYDRVIENKYLGNRLCDFKKVHVFYDAVLENYYFIKSLTENKEYYDIIDFHWIRASWTLNTNKIKKFCNHIFLTIWGSELEFQRILYSKYLYKYKLKGLLKAASTVVGTTKGERDVYGKLEKSVLKNYRFAAYGSEPLESLYELMESETKVESKGKMGLPLDKLIISIGYSGKALHRHKEVLVKLKAYKNIESIKNHCHVVLWMSYGCGESYIEEVTSIIKNTGIPFTLYRERLSTIEVARLRNSVDIVLQYSFSDAASNSILEFLTAGCLMISGTWLLYYNHFRDEGFDFLEVSDFESGFHYIDEIIKDPNKFKTICEANIVNGKDKYKWDQCILPWIKNYKEFI